MNRQCAWILLACAVWTILVWVTRIGIVFGNGSAAFRIVHAVLIVGSLAAGVATGWVGLKLLRESRSRESVLS
jgi:hypothetical protein